MAKRFDERAVELAVQAHVRHRETEYDMLFAKGFDRENARRAVDDDVHRVLDAWASPHGGRLDEQRGDLQ